jgi:multicomponent Na+:H+ antiporter subunit D
MIRAGLEAGAWWAVTAAVAAGLLTLLSMIKIWNEAFWKPRPEGVVAPFAPTGRARMALLVAPVVCLALVTLAIGLFPGPLFELAGRAAEELLDPAPYLEAVGLASPGGAP